MPSLEFRETVMRMKDAGDNCRMIIRNNQLKIVAQVNHL
jgi:hypothetical protein